MDKTKKADNADGKEQEKEKIFVVEPQTNIPEEDKPNKNEGEEEDGK